MDLKIDKEKFEHVLYVATSSTSEVFDSVSPTIGSRVRACEDGILGTTGAAAVGTASLPEDDVVTYVCLDAFLRIFRQLDLVLTPTGFGVVSNNKTAPASSKRVDSLEAQLQVARAQDLGVLLRHLTTVDGWSQERVSSENIRYVIFDIAQLEKKADREMDIGDWQAAQKGILEADIMLRRKVGDALMGDIMSKIRSGSADAEWLGAIRLMEEITFLHLWQSPMQSDRMDNLINYLEASPVTFNSYMDSEAYKVNHHESFKNDKSSPAFFFVG